MEKVRIRRHSLLQMKTGSFSLVFRGFSLLLLAVCLVQNLCVDLKSKFDFLHAMLIVS